MSHPKPLPMPERRITEAEVEAHLRRRMKKLGGECYKWSSPNNRGVADRICVFPTGMAWFIEVKAPDGKMSKLQNQFFSRMTQLKYPRARVLRSKEQIDNWLKHLGYD